MEEETYKAYAPDFSCPECGIAVGSTANRDPYKHAIQCFHLEDKGREKLLALHRKSDEERDKRIVALLEFKG